MVYRNCFLDKFFLGSLIMALVIGCGIKGPPVVPHSPIPQVIKDLQVFSRRGMIVLQWSAPTKDLEGKKLTSLGGFRLWRQFISVERVGCSTCPADFQLLAQIDYQVPRNARQRQGKMIYWDCQVEQEGKYVYKVTSFSTLGGESSASNLAEINWAPPFSPPDHFTAIPGDRVVNLSWKFPDSLRVNKHTNRLGGFNIYRRHPNKEYRISPLNKNPIRGSSFQDLGVTNGENYYYVVRSLKNIKGAMIESGDSAEIGARPEDFTPPASPSVTMAFQAQGGIVIIWEPNLDPDLDGYYVYRRLNTENKPTLISPLIRNQTMYLDRTFSPGLTYYYSVSAIDQSPRHNESDFSQELKVATLPSPGE